LTYIDQEGKMHRVSKGAPEQVISNTVYIFLLLMFFVLGLAFSLWFVTWLLDPESGTQ